MNARYAFELGYYYDNGLYLKGVPVNWLIFNDRYFYLVNGSKVYIDDLIKY